MKELNAVENAKAGFAAVEEARDFVKKIRHADAIDADEVRLDAYAAELAIERLEAALEAASNALAETQVALAGVAATARHASDYYAKAVAYGYKNSDAANYPDDFYQFEEDVWEASRTLDLLIPENQ